MGFDAIIEQTQAREHLTALLAADRVPNALLFVGPWGVGKTRTALILARALNCLERRDDACDVCPSCRKARHFGHPDIRLIVPMPHSQKKGAAKEEDEERQEAETLERLAEDPFHVIQFDRNPSIWIDKTRELKRLAAMTCAEGRRKVFVLREADRMRDDQANSLLKVLEEPPSDTHIVLTTARPQALLPTIVSRCQKVEFTALSREAIARVLCEHRELEPPDAAFCAALAQGSLGQALLMAGEDVRTLRDQALAVLAAAERGGAYLHTVVGAIAGERDRALIRRLAQALAVWHGDLLAVRYGLGDERIANLDRRHELEQQAARLDAAEIERRLGLFEELRVAMDQNVGYQVALYWLVACLADPEAAGESLLAAP
ncbi:MAG: AAA family ATPase [Candidatus Eiseniibacteriota bacterium]|jgi:DNA polymerase-3 subunit delta'